MRQWDRYAERSAWLRENADLPDYTEYHARVDASAVRVGELRDELAARCGVSEAEVYGLLVEVLEHLEAIATEAIETATALPAAGGEPGAVG